MKTKHLLVLAAGLLFTVIVFASATGEIKPGITDSVKGDDFLVLELFTSEGCSSCPRADDLLAKVQQQSGNKPVYILAYHVDYWDHQGWRDIFSSPDYTKRQYWYSGLLQSQVYTPQVVVNGKMEFVGSDQAAVSKVINSKLQNASGNSLKLEGEKLAEKMTITYQVSGTTDKEQLVVAVVQKQAERHIKRGENIGRTLRHVQIVRDLRSFALDKTGRGEVSVRLPDAFSTDSWEIIGFVQNRKTGAILAANRLTVLETQRL